MNYFISDIHLGHKNILSFDKRPFKTNEEQDEYIIKHWNERITDNDDVWILGDISWIGIIETVTFYKQLHGRLHLIIGNHDGKYIKSRSFRVIFDSIENYKELKIDDQRSLVLSHYPLLSYKNARAGWIQFYGHVHNTREWTLMEQAKEKLKALYYFKDGAPYKDIYNSYNVGCMCPYINYIPRSFEEIIKGYNKCKNDKTLNLRPFAI